MNLVIKIIVDIARFIRMFPRCILRICLQCVSGSSKRVVRKKRYLLGRKISDFMDCHRDLLKTRSMMITAIKYCEHVELSIMEFKQRKQAK